MQQTSTADAKPPGIPAHGIDGLIGYPPRIGPTMVAALLGVSRKYADRLRLEARHGFPPRSPFSSYKDVVYDTRAVIVWAAAHDRLVIPKRVSSQVEPR